MGRREGGDERWEVVWGMVRAAVLGGEPGQSAQAVRAATSLARL